MTDNEINFQLAIRRRKRAIRAYELATTNESAANDFLQGEKQLAMYTNWHKDYTAQVEAARILHDLAKYASDGAVKELRAANRHHTECERILNQLELVP